MPNLGATDDFTGAVHSARRIAEIASASGRAAGMTLGMMYARAASCFVCGRLPARANARTEGWNRHPTRSSACRAVSMT
jgi:hypothetical protein